MSIWDTQAAQKQLARALALDARGRDEEATQAYLDVLALAPDHVGALISLSTLLAKRGQRSAAQTALRHALEVKPDSAVAHTNLAALLCDDGDVTGARRHYQEAVQLDGNNKIARKGLAILLLRLGELDAARHHGSIGFRDGAEVWPYRGHGRPLSVLVAFSAIGGNLPIHRLLDDRKFLKWTIVAEFANPATPLPPHDVAIHGIGDADLVPSAMVSAGEILARSTAPLINEPTRVLKTTRAHNASTLEEIPGVIMARVRELPRAALLAADAPDVLAGLGFAWPLLIRSPGFHTGQHFAKVDAPNDLAAAVAELPGATLLVLQFLDTRNADGNFRKYRVMIIDGRLYPLHLAISARWKVHFLSADMAEHPEHRAEDEAFLRDMDRALGPTVLQTLARVADQLQLDYGGIDFAIDAEANVVVFEANATMIILPPDGDARWAYRVAPVARVQRAFEELLYSRAGWPAPEPGA